jgi:hypothetical protein
MCHDRDVVRTLVVVVVLAGCRFAFDPLGGDNGGLGDGGLGEGGLGDGAGPPCEPVACGAAGGLCQAETCVILQTDETAVTCPAGMACRIECTGNNRPCRDGASCGDATTCELRCIGDRACQLGTSCGTAPTCLVTCNGSEACESGITVGPGTTCTSHCCGTDACLGGVGSCSIDATCI